ncbi:MAG: serine hydrolase [Lachnospiraceae bacterium]|nr:serine hydrolase [Lachnospiraceae bacterium]
MKSIDKNQKKKGHDWNHWANRIFAGVLACILILAGVLGVILYRQSRVFHLSHEYSVEKQLPKDVTDSRNTQLAKGFASALCVTEANYNPANINVTSPDEKALIFNLDTSTVLFAQGIYDRVYPASITKIMTAILAVKYGNMDDVITITVDDLNLEEGSQMSGMQAGDTVTMDQLFHALMIYSANDAAMAIANHIGGNVDNFVSMMNEEARTLGMTGTHFVNPHGLHDENHYTTAYDVYLMLNAAYKYTEFYNAMQMNVYTLTVTKPDGSESSRRLDSTDHYLTGEAAAPKNVTVLGGKTGTTGEAGACLALVSQNAYGQPFISVILNAQKRVILYQDMNILLSQINS